MPPVFFGLITALAWGTSDFIARFTSTRLSPSGSLLISMATGAVTASLWLWGGHMTLAWRPEWIGLAVGSAVATAISMVMFYEALRRGPVTLVAPITGAYPAWSLLIGVLFLGLRPGWPAWGAMAVTILGMALVAGTGGVESAAEANGAARSVGALSAGSGPIRGRMAQGFTIRGRMAQGFTIRGRMAPGTLFLSLGAGFLFGLVLLLGQAAEALGGVAQTVWLVRSLTTVLALGPALLWPLLRRRRPMVLSSLPWLGVGLVQGLIDTLGHAAVLAPGPGLGGQIANVASTGLGAVTAVLARLILKEAVAPRQWAGMALVFGGIMALAWFSGQP